MVGMRALKLAPHYTVTVQAPVAYTSLELGRRIDTRRLAHRWGTGTSAAAAARIGIYYYHHTVRRAVGR